MPPAGRSSASCLAVSPPSKAAVAPVPVSRADAERLSDLMHPYQRDADPLLDDKRVIRWLNFAKRPPRDELGVDVGLELER